ncbi:Ubiquitin-conjugating enzyme E2 27-like protein [Gossypium australe]|uniref:Ubiquitin-conjugating enzyme E2 27-like protein n=1 Tax=Gossypium australe TaxID=47621 RepID=A0A5B6W1G1_9ROSI|nr:Ubiquitin-conjugating enzyme E2 27-like protein [Gossypium australe]
MKHLARILKELEECNTEQDSSGITLSLKPDNLTRLIGSIAGPLGTPYEGGSFQIHIALPGAYPYEPPRMKHPNISSQSGAMCLNILKDQWSPAVRLKTALLSVQALLSAPELRDPQDALVARQYICEYQTFIDTARSWTENFARVSSLGVEEKVKRLVEMGFADDLVRTS